MYQANPPASFFAEGRHRLRRTCARCGAALLIAGALCICMRAQTATNELNGPLRPTEASTAIAGEYLLHPGDLVEMNPRYTSECNDHAVVSPDGSLT